MTVLSAQTIRRLGLVSPMEERTQHEIGLSYGLSSCGYDVRLDQTLVLNSDHLYHFGDAATLASPYQMAALAGMTGHTPAATFLLASTLEQFDMPADVVGIVHDKSTLARMGIAVQNTVIEPGWRGHLTLEITFHGSGQVVLPEGTPIAQVVFHRLDEPTEQPYPEDGKYQAQERGPQGPR